MNNKLLAAAAIIAAISVAPAMARAPTPMANATGIAPKKSMNTMSAPVKASKPATTSTKAKSPLAGNSMTAAPK